MWYCNSKKYPVRLFNNDSCLQILTTKPTKRIASVVGGLTSYYGNMNKVGSMKYLHDTIISVVSESGFLLLLWVKQVVGKLC